MTNLTEVDFSNFKTANNTIAENSSGTTDNLPSFHTNTNTNTNTNLTFDGCSSLTTVNGVENMGTNVFKNNMFQNCTSLTEIDLSKATGLTAIPNNMFQGCTSLTTVKGMDKLTNLTVINDWAFRNCPNLTTIDLSQLSALTSINQNVFEGTALTAVNLTGSVNLTSIGSNAFANTSTTAEISTLIGGTSQDNYLLLPSGATDLGTNIFSGLNKVEKLDLSRATSLTNIGATGLGAGSKLEISLPTAQTVEIDGTNIAYTPATTLTLNANAPPNPQPNPQPNLNLISLVLNVPNHSLLPSMTQMRPRLQLGVPSAPSTPTKPHLTSHSLPAPTPPP